VYFYSRSCSNKHTREQLCNRYCSHKHTSQSHKDTQTHTLFLLQQSRPKAARKAPEEPGTQRIPGRRRGGGAGGGGGEEPRHHDLKSRISKRIVLKKDFIFNDTERGSGSLWLSQGASLKAVVRQSYFCSFWPPSFRATLLLPLLRKSRLTIVVHHTAARSDGLPYYPTQGGADRPPCMMCTE